MKKMYKLLSFVLGGLLLSACKSASTPRIITLTAADEGKTISIKVKDRLDITLEGNPTTGFQWEIDPQLNTALLRPVGEPIFVPASQAVGSGGEIQHSFEAVAAGKLTLTLRYHRVWETNVPPLKTYNLNVEVAP